VPPARPLRGEAQRGLERTGTDLMKLCFGRKVFGTKFYP
jgi:hypothetical protein